MITTNDEQEEARRKAWIIWGNMRKLSAEDQRRVTRILRWTVILNRWPKVANLYLRFEAWRMIRGREIRK